MTISEIVEILERAVCAIEPESRRQQFEADVIVPIRELRQTDESQSSSSVEVWIIAKTKGRDVGIAYSIDAYAEIGCPWGLVQLSNHICGSSGNWYSSLGGLVCDSGFYEAE